MAQLAQCQAKRPEASGLHSGRLEYRLHLGSILLNKSPTKVGTLNTAYQSKDTTQSEAGSLTSVLLCV